MKNLNEFVFVMSIESRGEVDWSLVKGRMSDVVRNLIGDRLKDGIEMEDGEWEDDFEFFSCGKEYNKWGMKECMSIECWDELGFIVCKLNDLKDLEKLNDELMGGYNYGYRISWEEIYEEMK